MAIQLHTFGKWILAGEHTVLRDGEALAFPIQTKYFSLNYHPSPVEKLTITAGSQIPHLKPFERALQSAIEFTARNPNELGGVLNLESNIPLGSGLGGSAAICVAIGRLFAELGWIDQVQLFKFCRDLENLFHGQSSGLDVATVLAGQGIRFQKKSGFSKINTNWKPNWYLTHSGVFSSTASDVKKVNEIFKINPALSNQLDTRMRQAVALAIESLQSTEARGLGTLVESMNMAASCFEEWQVIPSKMVELALVLKKLGALAVKPTGSGGGGYLLSLWRPGIKPDAEIDLLSVYA